MESAPRNLPLEVSIKTGIPTKGCPFILILILAFLFSCAGTRKVATPETVELIENVPFFPQEQYQCGPASLAGVLNYWGVDISPEEIAEEIYSKSAKGTLDMDMVLYAERKNLKTRDYRGSLEDIREKIDLEHPLIVLVDDGFWIYQNNHFMVVVGYDQNGIVANSGRDQFKYIPFQGFLKSWERTNFWTLLLTPK